MKVKYMNLIGTAGGKTLPKDAFVQKREKRNEKNDDRNTVSFLLTFSFTIPSAY